MRVFVTGGSGFVGGHVIEALAGEHEVVAMARSEGSAARVRELGATAVRASLEEVGPEHLHGIDAIVHAAAFVEEYGPRSAYERANVAGTDRLLDAARAAGVERFVLVSTNAVAIDGRGQREVDETAPYTGLRWFSYGRTKAESERRVLAANADGFTTVAIRPCFVWGPRDTTLLPALRRMADEGSFVWIDGGRARVSTTHVDNLVRGIVRALQGEARAIGGRAYFVADDGDTDVRGLLGGLARVGGFELAERSVPGAVVRALAWTLEGVWRLLGRAAPPPVTRMAALVMSHDMTVSTARARAELGWAPVIDREEGLAALVSPREVVDPEGGDGLDRFVGPTSRRVGAATRSPATAPDPTRA